MSGNEGKGMMGCLISLVILGLLVVVTLRAGPPYFAYRSFEADLRKEISRAGANAWDEETTTRNILELAKRNELPLARENITVERTAGMIHVRVLCTVPLDLIVYERQIKFEIRTSSLIGRL